MIRVKALSLGFYDNKRFREGQEFYLKNRGDMGAWMEEVTQEVAQEPEEAPKSVKPKKATKEIHKLDSFTEKLSESVI